jgi:hypothetical protein
MNTHRNTETIATSLERLKRTTSVEKLTETLLLVVQAMIEEKVEEIFPASERSNGSNDIALTDLVDALEIAKLLGRDVSTSEKVRAAKLYVYNLARQNLIPSVRISPRRIMFNLTEVRRVIASGGNAEPYRVA